MGSKGGNSGTISCSHQSLGLKLPLYLSPWNYKVEVVGPHQRLVSAPLHTAPPVPVCTCLSPCIGSLCTCSLPCPEKLSLPGPRSWGEVGWVPRSPHCIMPVRQSRSRMPRLPTLNSKCSPSSTPAPDPSDVRNSEGQAFYTILLEEALKACSPWFPNMGSGNPKGSIQMLLGQ